jgi:thiamine pyrophosphate-dependent acetolactate synthase large subunit-like protein
MTGIEAFLEMLAAAGVRYLFGNPGSTELALSDALAGDARFQYILGLQEVPVVSMADGYAMAAQSVGVANVHIACGLGNAMGMLYNAHCSGTPLLLTAGQQDRRLRLEEPVLVGELCQVARPWTKWAYEVQRVEDVPVAVRRAVQTALTPPTGPVFLALPLDVQTGTADRFDLAPPHVPTAACARRARRCNRPPTSWPRPSARRSWPEAESWSPAGRPNWRPLPDGLAPPSSTNRPRRTAGNLSPPTIPVTPARCRCGRRR